MKRKTYLEISAIDDYFFGDGTVKTGKPKIRETEFLCSLASSLPNNCKVVEIGSFIGKSAAALAAALEPINGQLICVDHFKTHSTHCPKQEELLRSNLEGYYNITIHPISSEEFFSKCVDTYDMIFIDGDHRKKPFVHDLVNSIKWSHNIVCGHDFCIRSPWIIDVIQHLSEVFSLDYEVVHWTWKLELSTELKIIPSNQLEELLTKHLEDNKGKYYYDTNRWYWN